jgi:hypothetical protein
MFHQLKWVKEVEYDIILLWFIYLPMSPKAESGARRPIRFLFLYIIISYLPGPSYLHTYIT